MPGPGLNEMGIRQADSAGRSNCRSFLLHGARDKSLHRENEMKLNKIDIQKLSDEQLLKQADRLAHGERELLLKVLRALKEIERRRLFAALKFKSLFDYAVTKLGYSSDQASRRIAAMRLLKELPEIESKINSGALNLTQLGLARTLFKKEKLPKARQLELLLNIENKSSRDTARIISLISPTALIHDKIKPVSESKDQLSFTADKSLKDKLDRLKGLVAHTHPGIGLGELVNLLADHALEHWDKAAAPRDSVRQDSDSQAGIRRGVFRRDQSCTNCGSTYALETDHRIAKGIGGESTIENLRLLCRSCNQRAAIETYGIMKMTSFLKSPRRSYQARDLGARPDREETRADLPAKISRQVNKFYLNRRPLNPCRQPILGAEGHH
jgi:hypothetical protein